jgi:parvulin-like peptidyl-prolyl isomerase
LAKKKSKKTKKKSLKKKTKKTKKESPNKIKKLKSKYIKKKIYNISFVVLLIFVIILGGIVIYNGTKGSDENFFQNLLNKINIKSLIKKSQSEIAAVVNEEEITLQELNNRYEKIPENYKQLITKETLLEQIVDEKLLLQKANQENIKVSDEELENMLNQTLSNYMMDKEQLKNELEKQGTSYEEFIELFKNELLISKLLNQTVTNINITEEEAEQFYDENPEQFSIPETVNASHILICHNESLNCLSNLSKLGAKDKIENILSKLKDNENDFSELAEIYSECPSSEKGGNLGFFTKGQMTPAFEDAAFDLEEDEISEIIETEFGFHIIKVHEKRDSDTLEFETVKTQIKQNLKVQKQQEVYQQFIQDLKDKAKIYVYYQAEAEQE